MELWWKVASEYQNENVHSFKEGVILLCQSVLETRRIPHLPGSARFTVPLTDQISLSDCLYFSRYWAICV